MNIKPGKQTSELWMAAIKSVVILLVTIGVLSADVADAVHGVAVAVMPLALAYISNGYSASRAVVKSAQNGGSVG